MNSVVISNPVYEEVQSERNRQDEKWGIQDHPSISDNIVAGPSSNLSERINRYYGIPTIDKAKYVADEAANKYDLTWGHIAVEELCEVIGADNEIHRRHELVQLAAVCIAWIDCLDRKMNKEKTSKEDDTSTIG